jgi:hypothetical protein
LPQFCQRTSESLACSLSAISTFPSGGMLVTFGADVSGGPAGVSTGGSILDRGTRTTTSEPTSRCVRIQATRDPFQAEQ